MNGPFHAGELAAQRLAGQASSGAAIRDFMPEQHREFFAAQPFMLMAAVAGDGWPTASVLSGAPGFAASPDPHTLQLAVLADLPVGSQVGLLGLDFATRRRNRVNGVVAAAGPQGLRIDVRQSFGNCPKYIVQRDVLPVAAGQGGILHDGTAGQLFDGLDAEARAVVARADTFFIATSGGAHGADISHRGGPAGFVRVAGDTLLVPDYPGNRYFNTLGNLQLEERAALLFIDYASGDLLQLRGRAEVLWPAGAADGAERWWRFEVAGGWRQSGALPLRWREREGSR
ncbi:pyridoxamine 5'-phosphate oxidase family protein [Rugamonas sp. CCM 8940]|uniref:pyridoxamine 5'-phosphate oxidase family protein n=1 Tax=Rugamonas sp. CCM 8940 TaxID=2765359 RepID=UPI0018F42309|nr:pyridoxamine 5'-phosphate oxidase family protein [Rugamonas sp. CCM 8940]MBJ7312032.1 pyridoxamine 5'-phosphate oxidase family protein [Rugamonas sp. CCM 8940]